MVVAKVPYFVSDVLDNSKYYGCKLTYMNQILKCDCDTKEGNVKRCWDALILLIGVVPTEDDWELYGGKVEFYYPKA
jgi:hypothetical protein